MVFKPLLAHGAHSAHIEDQEIYIPMNVPCREYEKDETKQAQVSGSGG